MKGVPRRWVCLGLVSVLTAGCAATPSGGGRLRPIHSSPNNERYAAAPDWYADALSWDKLRRIESWLASDGPDYWPESVPRAEIELAKGRVELSEREASTAGSSVLAVRLDLAEAGFRRVLADPRTSAFHRSEADAGLRDVERLRGGATAAAAPTRRSDTGTILSRSTWGAAPASVRQLTPNRRPWTRITVHHSATSVGSSPASVNDAIRRVQKDHMQGQGWGDIGYHFLIDAAGNVHQGRSLAYQGAHAGGQNNVANIGICMLGDFANVPPDPRALRALEALIDALCERHGIPHSAVRGHSDYKATECPGSALLGWVRRYAASS